jgi:hypothetical protein
MHVIGPVEMAVGAVILSGYTRLGGYVATIWLSGMMRLRWTDVRRMHKAKAE